MEGPSGFGGRMPRGEGLVKEKGLRDQADTVSEAGSARTEASSYAESRAAAQRTKLRARGAGNLLTGGEALPTPATDHESTSSKAGGKVCGNRKTLLAPSQCGNTS